MLAMAVAVGLSSIAIGSILSTALLIGPAATALRITRPCGVRCWRRACSASGSNVGRIVLAYDSSYWDPSTQGLPVSTFIVASRSSPTSSPDSVIRLTARPKAHGSPIRSAGHVPACERWPDVRGIHDQCLGDRAPSWPSSPEWWASSSYSGGRLSRSRHPQRRLRRCGRGKPHRHQSPDRPGSVLVAGRPRHRTLGRRGRADAVTALALVMMLALGAAFLSQSTEYEPQIFSLLFGEILGVSSSEILPVALLGLVCIVAVGVLYRRLMLTSVVPEIAEARGSSRSQWRWPSS